MPCFYGIWSLIDITKVKQTDIFLAPNQLSVSDYEYLEASQSVQLDFQSDRLYCPSPAVPANCPARSAPQDDQSDLESEYSEDDYEIYDDQIDQPPPVEGDRLEQTRRRVMDWNWSDHDLEEESDGGVADQED